MGLRFFNVYGPRQDPSSPYSGVIAIFSECLKRKLPVTIFGDGRQERDFVYVADVVRALLAAGADVNAKRVDGSTALMIASQHNRLGVEQLLKASIPPPGK